MGRRLPSLQALAGMSATRFIKLFGTDWRDGTRGLSLAAQGLYIALITLMHEQGGSVPDDTRKLCRWLGIKNRRTLEKPLDELIICGKIKHHDGRFYNDRVTRDIARRREIQESFAVQPRPRVAVDKAVPNLGNTAADKVNAMNVQRIIQATTTNLRMQPSDK